jgi:hypothetical protein
LKGHIEEEYKKQGRILNNKKVLKFVDITKAQKRAKIVPSRGKINVGRMK